MLLESNPEIGGGAAVGDLPAGQTTDFIVDDDQVCSADLAAGEPDTATLTCQCATDIGGQIEVSAFDEASFTCKGEGCITRTPGYWKNHPEITELFLPVETCGVEVTDPCDPVIDDGSVGVPGEAPQQKQLRRQCAAAAINISATTSDFFLGSCSDFSYFFMGEDRGIDDLLALCCNGAASYCERGKAGEVSGLEISRSGCIDAIDRFNNSEDTFVDEYGNFVEFCPNPILGTEPPCDGGEGLCK